VSHGRPHAPAEPARTPQPAPDIAPAGRVLGVDLGAVRVGVAVSDSGQLVASPLVTLPRSGDLTTVLARLVREEEAVGIVLGLPLSLDGSVGPAARSVLQEADAVREESSVPVVTHDERFTTVTAARSLQQAGRRGGAARRAVDQIAAAVILQSWLDGRHRGGPA
jgi:putative Holliday junction resolvase